MGSLESWLPLKRDRDDNNSSSSSNRKINDHGTCAQRCRSRLARLLFFKRIDYSQLICVAFVLFFFGCLVQMMFLPGAATDDDRKYSKKIREKNGDGHVGDWSFLKEFDNGDDVKLFEPSTKFKQNAEKFNGTVGSREVIRFGYKKPKLALVFADLWVDHYQILMVTIAAALREVDYEIEVFTLEDGPVHTIWREVGVSVSVITADENMKFSIDWLNYNGILVNSLKGVGVFSSLMQEPFRNVPLVWIIHEQTLAVRLKNYVISGQTELVDNWRKVFDRATVVVFPNYILPMAYSACDPGNYFVIPGSPAEAWKADKLLALFHEDNLHLKIHYGQDDFVVAVVGSQLFYRGFWLDHAVVLQALYPVLKDFGRSSSRLKIIILAGNSTYHYSNAVEAIARHLKYPNGTVEHVAVDEADRILISADLVIYGSFLDELTFPDIMLKAMCFGRPIIAPDLPMIRKYVRDRVNGFIFPREDIGILTLIVSQLVSNGKISLLARKAALIGKSASKNLLALESVNGYASLLTNILKLPSEVTFPQAVKEIPIELKAEWQWHRFEDFTFDRFTNETGRIYGSLSLAEKQFNRARTDNSIDLVATNDTFCYSIWEDQEYVDVSNMRKIREDEELKDRTDTPRGTWDEIYKNARRDHRPLRERDEGELERTGQPLCIYEPYLGEGTWPFLHRTSLYRGIGLSTEGRRPGADDVDAPSRLPLLTDAYYRDVLGEFGAFFAISNRIDRIHKNAWIGFQSWRATARMKSLSKTAERSLLDAIEARRHGDTLYFWARLEMDPRYRFGQDFWSFCDAINAGNCRFAFSEALREMYGIKQEFIFLPIMPIDGTWAVVHCWVLPTLSFVEFVMFSRMFVDALDAHFYDEHWKTGRCYLSLSKDTHCYSRLLELLINVWAYHSARKMVYVDPKTGSMQEQHKLNSRRGRMWIKWFDFTTLKSMDEDLAEEFDSDGPKGRRWLWPSTGEVFWKGIYEKEMNLRMAERKRKRQASREKIQRMKRRARQKALGEYVKPAEEN